MFEQLTSGWLADRGRSPSSNRFRERNVHWELLILRTGEKFLIAVHADATFLKARARRATEGDGCGVSKEMLSLVPYFNRTILRLF